MTIRIVPTQPEHYQRLAELQISNFPTIDESEAFTVEMFARHVELFPDGQMTALVHEDGRDIVAGCTVTFRTHQPFETDPDHDYFTFIGHGWLTAHEADGVYLYGVDMNLDPAFRGRGIARLFYDARRDLVRRLGLKGEIVAGLLPGYPVYREMYTVHEYANRVVAGDIFDPTFSVQLRNGFVLDRLLHGYVHDPRSDNWCTLMRRDA